MIQKIDFIKNSDPLNDPNRKIKKYYNSDLIPVIMGNIRSNTSKNNGSSDQDIRMSNDNRLADDISLDQSELNQSTQGCSCGISCFPKFTSPEWMRRINAQWNSHNTKITVPDEKTLDVQNQNDNQFTDNRISDETKQNIETGHGKTGSLDDCSNHDHTLTVPYLEMLPDDQIIDGLHHLSDLVEDDTQSVILPINKDYEVTSTNKDHGMHNITDGQVGNQQTDNDKKETNIMATKNVEIIGIPGDTQPNTQTQPELETLSNTPLYVVNLSEPENTLDLKPSIQIEGCDDNFDAVVNTNVVDTEPSITESEITESSINQSEHAESHVNITPIKRLKSKTDQVTDQNSTFRNSLSLSTSIESQLTSLSLSPSNDMIATTDLDEKYKLIYENLKVIRNIKPNDKLRVSSIGELSIEQSYIPSLTRTLTGNNKIVTIARIDETIKIAKQLRKISQIKQLLDDQLASGLRNLGVTYANDDVFKDKLESIASAI